MRVFGLVGSCAAKTGLGNWVADLANRRGGSVREAKTNAHTGASGQD